MAPAVILHPTPATTRRHGKNKGEWNSVAAAGATGLTASDGSTTTIDVTLSGAGLNCAGPAVFHPGNMDLTGDRVTTTDAGGSSQPLMSAMQIVPGFSEPTHRRFVID